MREILMTANDVLENQRLQISMARANAVNAEASANLERAKAELLEFYVWLQTKYDVVFTRCEVDLDKGIIVAPEATEG